MVRPGPTSTPIFRKYPIFETAKGVLEKQPRGWTRLDHSKLILHSLFQMKINIYIYSINSSLSLINPPLFDSRRQLHRYRFVIISAPHIVILPLPNQLLASHIILLARSLLIILLQPFVIRVARFLVVFRSIT